MTFSSKGEPGARQARDNRVATLLLAAVAAAAPLPYGLTDPVVLAVFVALLGLILLILKPKLRGKIDVLLACWLGLTGAGYALVLQQQLSPDFYGGFQPDVVWRQMADLLKDGNGSLARLSVARDQPLFALGNVLACLATVTCAFLVSRERLNAERLLQVIGWSGVAYALYGICSFLFSPETVLFREKALYRTVLTATFLNRNTAALYFGVCSMLWALILARDARRHGVLRKGEWRFGKLQRRMAAPCAGFFVCVLAMMLTGSRGGVVVSLGGTIAAALLLLRRDLDSRRAKRWTFAAILAGAGSIFLLLGGQVTERLSEHGLTGGGRWQTYLSTLKMIVDHPLVGAGLGTFPFIFPRYRSGEVSIWGVWDRGHNTLLELAAEAGIPLATIVVLAWIIALMLMFQGVRQRRSGAIYPIAGLVCSAMALVHSMIDFSLQIPGFAINVMVLVGIGLGQRQPDLRQEKTGISPSASRLTV